MKIYSDESHLFIYDFNENANIYGDHIQQKIQEETKLIVDGYLERLLPNQTDRPCNELWKVERSMRKIDAIPPQNEFNLTQDNTNNNESPQYADMDDDDYLNQTTADGLSMMEIAASNNNNIVCLH